MSDEQSLHAMHNDFMAAWSRGDAHAAAAFWVEDGVRVGAAGDVQHGRAEIEAALATLFAGRFKGARLTVERGSVRLLTADLALFQGAIRIDTEGGEPVAGYVLDVMKNVSGRWFLLESHPKLFPPRG